MLQQTCQLHKVDQNNFQLSTQHFFFFGRVKTNKKISLLTIISKTINEKIWIHCSYITLLSLAHIRNKTSPGIIIVNKPKAKCSVHNVDDADSATHKQNKLSFSSPTHKHKMPTVCVLIVTFTWVTWPVQRPSDMLEAIRNGLAIFHTNPLVW